MGSINHQKILVVHDIAIPHYKKHAPTPWFFDILAVQGLHSGQGRPDHKEPLLRGHREVTKNLLTDLYMII